jgi:hypothetical protein
MMANNSIPKPPEPPEIRLQCGTCGHTAPKSEYKHTCWYGIVVIGAVVISALLVLGILIYPLFAIAIGI